MWVYCERGRRERVDSGGGVGRSYCVGLFEGWEEVG